ncbi:MAG: class I SAM-dependent methyltransferase [Spirochaetia bacterium]
MKTYSSKPNNEELREVSCGVCGHSAYQLAWDLGDYRFQKCLNCGVYYQNPQPVFQELKNRYEEDYLEYEIENEANFLGLMLKGLSDINFQEIISRYAGDAPWFLDIGCATGALLEQMKKKGLNVKGVEISSIMAQYGKNTRGIDIVNTDLETAGFSDNEFHFIHSSHVIEHVPHPGDFVREVYRILKPGGYFICTTPNASGFQARLFQEKWRSAIADHMYLFSKKNLKDLLFWTGFSIEREKTWGGLAIGAGPVIIKKILDPLSKRLGFGDVMLLLAKKPIQ